MNLWTGVVAILGVIATIGGFLLGRRVSPWVTVRTANRSLRDPSEVAAQISGFITHQTGIALQDADARAIALYAGEAVNDDLSRRLDDTAGHIERWRLTTILTAFVALIAIGFAVFRAGGEPDPGSAAGNQTTRVPTPPLRTTPGFEKPLEAYAQELAATCPEGATRRDSIGGSVLTCKVDALSLYAIRYDGPATRASREPGKVVDDCTRQIIGPEGQWTHRDGRSGRYIRFTEACGGRTEGKVWLAYGGETGSVVMMLAGNWDTLLGAKFDLPNDVLAKHGYTLQ